MQDPHGPPIHNGIRYWLTGEGLPRDGLTEGKACRTSMRLLRGAPTHSLNSALPSGLARCRKRAASSSLLADAARAGKQDLCAGAQRSAYLAKAVRRLTGPVQNIFFHLSVRSAGKQDLCTGTQRSAYLAEAVGRLARPVELVMCKC